MQLKSRTKLITFIQEAFLDILRPADAEFGVANPFGDDEITHAAGDFAASSHWNAIDPELFDSSPDGVGTALTFLSPAATRYVIAAFLCADIEGQSEQVEPRDYLIGRRVQWYLLDMKQVCAIIAYLEWTQERLFRSRIACALSTYWSERI